MAALRAALDHQAGLARSLQASVASRNVAVAPTSAMQEHDPFNDPRKLNLARTGALNDTPRDNSCLFHALAACLRGSPHVPHSLAVVDAKHMRAAISRFIFQNPTVFQAQHEKTIRAQAARELGRPLDDVPYELAVRTYCDWLLEPTSWGGQPELDAAAVMLGVAVHQFQVPHANGGFETAVLESSYFPLSAMADDRASQTNLTKFVVVWRDNHYWHATPQVPRALQPAASAPSAPSNSEAEPPMTARQRADHMNNRRRGASDGRSSSSSSSNQLLAEARRERERRAADREAAKRSPADDPARDQGDGHACPSRPVALSQAQRRAIDVAEAARQAARDAYDATISAFLRDLSVDDPEAGLD